MLYEVHSLFLLTFNIVFHQLVDGESVTTMRTAAASAVALKVVSFSLLFCMFPFFFSNAGSEKWHSQDTVHCRNWCTGKEPC